MFVHCTIKTYEEVGIKPSKTYQSFVAAAGNHRELSLIEKYVRNYITREVRNIFEQDDAKEFGKNWNDFVTKYSLGGNKWLSGNRGFNSNYFHAVTFLSCTKIAIYGFSLPGSPLLGRDEKHTKDREHAHIFQQVHHTQQLLESICEATDNCLASREKREREFDVADFHTMILCATKSAIKGQFQYVYTPKSSGKFKDKSEEM
ncbi:hypothetical protein Ahy_A03g013741 [Arachis hypogaea]|uniref:Protein FAR1-RELATED SEQUENCE n=1 Tax=Arachis hypogaea TaxID=3818 RepID=A0A445DW35_ARAHY|nr:hypothetical protein Ahy_A03g013741 [Arachis hypogaea]